MRANSSLTTTCGPKARVTSSVRGRVYRLAGLEDATLVRPTRRSMIRPACEKRFISRCTVVRGTSSFSDISVMLYSVPGWRRSRVRSSAWCCDRRIGMRAGASARIDGRYHPFKGRVKGRIGMMVPSWPARDLRGRPRSVEEPRGHRNCWCELHTDKRWPEPSRWPKIAKSCACPFHVLFDTSKWSSLRLLEWEPKWEPTCTDTEPRQAPSGQRCPR